MRSFAITFFQENEEESVSDIWSDSGFAIVAIPRNITSIEAQGIISEVVCLVEIGIHKLMEHLRSFALQP